MPRMLESPSRTTCFPLRTRRTSSLRNKSHILNQFYLGLNSHVILQSKRCSVHRIDKVWPNFTMKGLSWKDLAAEFSLFVRFLHVKISKIFIVKSHEMSEIYFQINFCFCLRLTVYQQCCQKVWAKNRQIFENLKRPTSKQFQNLKRPTSKASQKSKISTSKL